MLSESHHDRLTVVLVSPRNPLNIGAAARAMANFGFQHLAAVAPYEAHWREARSAIGAEKLLQDAKSAKHLAEAVSDCTLVIGTGSLTRRKPPQRVVPLPALAPIVQKELAHGGRAALVFGSEKRGLSRDDLALCHVLVEIPTDARQPSMNLGQAVAVCLYELSSRRSAIIAPGDQSPQPPGASAKNPAGSLATRAQATPAFAADDLASVSAGDLDLLAGLVAEAMRAANYSPKAMHQANQHDLQLLLHRLTLTQRDARRILGLFRRILWRLKH